MNAIKNVLKNNYRNTELDEFLKEELKDAGLIKGEIDGAKVCYCIDEKEWKAAQVWINQLFNTYKTSGNCC